MYTALEHKKNTIIYITSLTVKLVIKADECQYD